MSVKAEASTNRTTPLPGGRIAAADVIWSAQSITAPESARVLLFESRGLLFALPAESVREVIYVPATHAITGSATWFEGVAVYRKRPVPVLDAAAYFAPESPDLVFNRAVVVHVASNSFLIAADKILNLCKLPSADQTPLMHRLPDYAEHRAIKKVCSYENSLLAVIDLPEFLRCTKLLRECAFC